MTLWGFAFEGPIQSTDLLMSSCSLLPTAPTINLIQKFTFKNLFLQLKTDRIIWFWIVVYDLSYHNKIINNKYSGDKAKKTSSVYLKSLHNNKWN